MGVINANKVKIDGQITPRNSNAKFRINDIKQMALLLMVIFIFQYNLILFLQLLLSLPQ